MVSRISKDSLCQVLFETNDESFNLLTDLAVEICSSSSGFFGIDNQGVHLIKTARRFDSLTEVPTVEDFLRLNTKGDFFEVESAAVGDRSNSIIQWMNQNSIEHLAGTKVYYESLEPFGIFVVLDDAAKKLGEFQKSSLNTIKKQIENVIRMHFLHREKKRLSEYRKKVFSFAMHDIKSPLTILKGNLMLLEADLKDTELHGKQIEKMKKSINRIVKLLTGILKEDSKNFQGLSLNKEPVDTTDLLEKLDVESKFPGWEIDIVNNFPEQIKVDVDLFIRVLENLISNAYKYGGPKQFIEIQCERLPDLSVCFSVRDYGKGVASDKVEAIFDSHNKTVLESSDAILGGSQGLGLEFCKFVIQAHGGEIWVEDAKPGARFFVSLPLNL